MSNLLRAIQPALLLIAMLSVPAMASTAPAAVDLSNDEWVAQPPRRPAAAQVTAPQGEDRAKATPSANPLWGIPLSKLTSTRNRPIFSPSRRPPPPIVAARPPTPPPPPPPKQEEPERPKLNLLGTIVNGKDGYGIFMDEAKKAPIRLRIGASHQGWILRSLQPDSATLGKGFLSSVLVLPKRDPKQGLSRTSFGGALTPAAASERQAPSQPSLENPFAAIEPARLNATSAAGQPPSPADRK